MFCVFGWIVFRAGTQVCPYGYYDCVKIIRCNDIFIALDIRAFFILIFLRVLGVLGGEKIFCGYYDLINEDLQFLTDFSQALVSSG